MKATKISRRSQAPKDELLKNSTCRGRLRPSETCVLTCSTSSLLPGTMSSSCYQRACSPEVRSVFCAVKAPTLTQCDFSVCLNASHLLTPENRLAPCPRCPTVAPTLEASSCYSNRLLVAFLLSVLLLSHCAADPTHPLNLHPPTRKVYPT